MATPRVPPARFARSRRPPGRARRPRAGSSPAPRTQPILVSGAAGCQCYDGPALQYRLLALDLDGTLLRSDGRVDDRDRDAIAELQRAGVAVTIVTGRLYSGSLAAARACAIAGTIACVEGSHLVD